MGGLQIRPKTKAAEGQSARAKLNLKYGQAGTSFKRIPRKK